MFYVNTGNRSIYASQVVGTLPSPQGITHSTVDVDLTKYPPVRRSSLSIAFSTIGDIYYPAAIFRWTEAASVACASRMTDEDRETFMSNGPAFYAVFGPADNRSDADVIVDDFRARGLRVAVRTGSRIVGEDKHGVFNLPGVPTGDAVMVSDFSDRYKDKLEAITLLGGIKQFIIDDRSEDSIDVAKKYKVVPVGDPGVAKLAIIAGDPTLYRVVADEPEPSPHNNDDNDDAGHVQQPGVSGDQEAPPSDRGKSPADDNHIQSYTHEDRVTRHGTVTSLLAMLNRAQFLALSGNAAVRTALVERAIADADVIATDIISVDIVYPIKLDVYVDEDMGERYDRSIVLRDELVTVKVTKRMSRARRFMSWFVVPTAIVAGVVTIVKDSVAIGRGRT